jgi:acyl carrier protein
METLRIAARESSNGRNGLNDEVFAGVKRIAAELFDVPAGKITLETSPDTIEAWDSIQQLNLMLELEQRFEVKLEPEDFEDARTIGDAVRLVERQLQARTGI